jgi:hypothetical protein
MGGLFPWISDGIVTIMMLTRVNLMLVYTRTMMPISNMDIVGLGGEHRMNIRVQVCSPLLR